MSARLQAFILCLGHHYLLVKISLFNKEQTMPSLLPEFYHIRCSGFPVWNDSRKILPLSPSKCTKVQILRRLLQSTQKSCSFLLSLYFSICKKGGNILWYVWMHQFPHCLYVIYHTGKKVLFGAIRKRGLRIFSLQQLIRNEISIFSHT